MSATYTIKSVKGTQTVTGTAADAVRAALAHEEEYQPAFGTDIEWRGATLMTLDGSGSDLIEELRDEASEAGDREQVAECDAAIEDDCDGATRRRVLAQILSVAVEAAQ